MRKVTIRLYRFDELSPEAQKKALEHERKDLFPCVKEMAEAYIGQELAQSGLILDSLEIDYETCQASVSISADGPQSEKQKQILDDIMATLKEELPYHLSDEYVKANIEADKQEFLEDGELWLYLDKELLNNRRELS